jgi:hypothetical protein
MSPTLTEAKQYLYRYGTMTDTTVEPVELIRDLVVELERCEARDVAVMIKVRKKPKARAKSGSR